MIEIENKLLSTDLFNKEFICNLSACKGACCVEGNAGAPVAEDEVEILQSIFPQIKPYLSEKGICEIERVGTSVDGIGEKERPLLMERNVRIRFSKKTVRQNAESSKPILTVL